VFWPGTAAIKKNFWAWNGKNSKGGRETGSLKGPAKTIQVRAKRVTARSTMKGIGQKEKQEREQS